jgi:hypothetical protein
MQIDKSNYEIWLIDWIDGNLSDSQIEQLQLFLNENPDLQEEFYELNSFKLNFSNKSFQKKNLLIKTDEDLPLSQFEYLCVAYLENDLSSVQKKEIKSSIEKDPEKKMSFELIQRMRLTPIDFPYKHKKQLIRKTIAQKVIRVSLIGLSAAAMITLIVLTFILNPHDLQNRTSRTSQTILADSIAKKPAIGKVSETIKTGRKIVKSGKQSKNLLSMTQKTVSAKTENKINPPVQIDSMVNSAGPSRTSLNKIPFSPEIILKTETIPHTLIALNYEVALPEYDDERPRLGRFIARNFREKILKEKKAKDTPLKIYEIAEAGVSGLDKLLGWEMALDEKKDMNGEIKSVYFSSKIFKFNAPIKKTEPVQ